MRVRISEQALESRHGVSPKKEPAFKRGESDHFRLRGTQLNSHAIVIGRFYSGVWNTRTIIVLEVLATCMRGIARVDVAVAINK